jgi:hypothetical protein
MSLGQMHNTFSDYRGLRQSIIAVSGNLFLPALFGIEKVDS